MSVGRFAEEMNGRLFLHPAVGLWADPAKMDARQKVVAVAKVRCLEHDLFDGNRVRRELSQHAVEEILGEMNGLRRALGWLAVDLEGRTRTSHLRSVTAPGL